MKIVRWPVDSTDTQNTYHWCPACECLHELPDRWTRTGPDSAPTYTPSFVQHRPKDPCHYVITEGRIQFVGDSWHGRTDTIEMPDIPEHVLADLTDAIFNRN